MSFPSPEQYTKPREMTTARNWSQVARRGSMENCSHPGCRAAEDWSDFLYELKQVGRKASREAVSNIKRQHDAFRPKLPMKIHALPKMRPVR